jgi:hypothetical protein
MNTGSHRGRPVGVGITSALLGAFALLFGTSSSAVAESRGYVISMVHTATYANADTCPNGGNGGPNDFRKKRLMLTEGLSAEEAVKRIAAEANQNQDQQLAQAAAAAQNPAAAAAAPAPPRPQSRGPNVGNFPTSAPDPNIELASGRYAFGFNLDGQEAPGSFEDPVSHERGVDNNLWRVVGCFTVYNVRLPIRPYSEDIAFDTSIDAMPAWVMSVSGDDLSKDGEVTVTFDHALNVAMRNTYAGLLSGATYTIDPDPRNHSVHKGRIKDQVLTVEGGEYYSQGDSQWYPLLRFSNTHLRVKMAPDGSLEGIIGGYQPWKDFFYFLAIRGEGTGQVDLAGSYNALKRLADGPPDPVTGERTSISAAYRFQAVPAFLATSSGTVVATSVGAGPAINGPGEAEGAVVEGAEGLNRQ